MTGFMGGLEQALTGVVGEEPLVPQLAGILGTVEGMQRWQDLLRSGSRTGRELTILWQILLEEARQSSYYLEEDMVQGPPEQPVEGAGEECTTGEKRHLLTTYLEDQRLKVLASMPLKYILTRQLVLYGYILNLTNSVKAGSILCLDPKGSTKPSSVRPWPGFFVSFHHHVLQELLNHWGKGGWLLTLLEIMSSASQIFLGGPLQQGMICLKLASRLSAWMLG